MTTSNGWVGALVASVALVLAIAISWPGGAVAEGSSDPNYTVYGGCGDSGDTKPSHLCHKGDRLGAFFRSDASDVSYDVCVRFPTGMHVCATDQWAEQGVLYSNKVTSGVVGRTTITWSVGAVQVGTWSFDLYPDPVVSKFGVNPLVVARQHRLAGIQVRYGGNGSRVRAWRRCNGVCRLRLRRAGKRNGIRRFLLAGRRRTSFEIGDLLYVLVDAPDETDGHGSRIWGRLYTGRLIKDPRGGPSDTAIRHIGPLRCVPPGTDFRQATSCDRVSWEWPP